MGLKLSLLSKCISSDRFGEISIERNALYLSSKVITCSWLFLPFDYFQLRVWDDACYKNKEWGYP